MPWVSQTGSPGINHSVNAPIIPGALNLLLAINANPRRNAVGVQNQSTATLTVARDDGTGNNITPLILAPAAKAATGTACPSRGVCGFMAPRARR